MTRQVVSKSRSKTDSQSVRYELVELDDGDEVRRVSKNHGDPSGYPR